MNHNATAFLFANGAASLHYWPMPEPPVDLLRTRTSLIGRLGDWQDDASWTTFLEIYRPFICRFARKAGLTATEAEDIAQETALAVAKQMPRFKYDRTIGSFRHWLQNNIRWRIVDLIRKRPATGNAANLSDNFTDPSGLDLDKVWDAEWENALMHAALSNVKRRVDPKKYQVFDFYVNKDWPAEKVAVTFGIAVSQVYLAKHRVTEMIKAEVKRLARTVI